MTMQHESGAGGAAEAPMAGPGGPSGARPAPPRRRRGFVPRRKVCQFCVDKVDTIDYKDFRRLQRYVSERGKIEPRRKTGTCSKHQRTLTTALKRARHIALLPFTGAHMREASPYSPRG